MYKADTMDDFSLENLEKEIEVKNKVEERIKNLSEKVRLTSEERDNLAKLKQDLEIERDTAIKEKNFYANFADSVSKYPEAAQFKDKIREKVLAGYDPEDATLAILAREGKLSQKQEAVVERESPAGGSASTNVPISGSKPVKDMSRDEKRAALLDLESNGELNRNNL